jgi:hypothetical protein
MSKTVSMIIFDGSIDSFAAVRKFIRDENLLTVHLTKDPAMSFLTIMSGETAIGVMPGEFIVRKANGILSSKKRKRVAGYAD